MEQIYVWDRTQTDKKSAVRGIGRYIQTLTLGLGTDAHVLSQLPSSQLDGIFFDPHISLYTRPLYVRKPGRITIGTIHDTIVLKYPKQFPLGIRGGLYALLQKYINSRLYDAVLTDSEASKRDILNYVELSKERVHVLYPPVASHFFQQKRGVRPALDLPERYCIYVGDVTWNKNLVVLARAIIQAGIPLVCVGKALDEPATENSWHREFKAFLKITQGEHLFTCIGFVPDDELIWLYRNALCNILVSRDEGFGYSYAESALCGTPSVLSDIPVLREVAGDSALFAPANDAAQIAQAITSYTDTNVREKMAKRAQSKAMTFSTDAFVKGFRNIVNQL
ncbi:MAG: glycosyltransferase family 4 protein [Candidatus Roizmanbacteria bacterium]|nr:glycosyltransferase family 4 protein [Candidatus Roizmanbacteria bacterium]